MTFLDLLRSARGTTASLLHTYRLQLAPISSQRRVHAFLEGHDDESYYVHHLTTRTSEYEIKTYKCGGRDVVLDMHDLVRAEAVTLTNFPVFFVDKDLSDIIDRAEQREVSEVVYVTDFYSIENHLVGWALFERAWRELVRVSNMAIDLTVIRESFLKAHESFYRSVLPVVGWFVAMRRLGYKPKFSAVDLKDVLEFDEDLNVHRRECCKRGKLLAYLEKRTGIATPMGSRGALASAARDIRQQRRECVVRGKYDVWFFVNFWRKSLEAANLVAKESGGRAFARTDLHQENFVETVCSRVACPESLGRFIARQLPEGEPISEVVVDVLPEDIGDSARAEE